MSSVQHDCSGDEQFVAGSLRGYRAWRLIHPKAFQQEPMYVTYDEDTGEELLNLQASAFHIMWPKGRYTAKCQSRADRGDHVAPDPRCKCGIYAWYSPLSTRLVRGDVTGVVKASGRILMGTKGFRAEHAEIIAVAPVFPQPHNKTALDYLRDRGVHVCSSTIELWNEFPPDDVSELIPDATRAIDYQQALSRLKLDPIGDLATTATNVGKALQELSLSYQKAMEKFGREIIWTNTTFTATAGSGTTQVSKPDDK